MSSGDVYTLRILFSMAEARNFLTQSSEIHQEKISPENKIKMRHLGLGL